MHFPRVCLFLRIKIMALFQERSNKSRNKQSYILLITKEHISETEKTTSKTKNNLEGLTESGEQ